MSKDKLSPTMQKLIEYMRANANTIKRFPGGFWARDGWTLHSGEYFATPSVHALVDRGVAHYTQWQESKRYAGQRFPIEAQLVS